MSKISLNYSNEQDKFSIDSQEICDAAEKMLEYILNKQEIFKLSVLNSYDLKDIEIVFDLLISDDEFIHELNLNYRDKNNATDVLTFALFADDPDSGIVMGNQIQLGEIIISTETAKRQADENSKTFEDEMFFLLSHGILHLLGFDHPDEESLEFMLKTQTMMMDSIIQV